MSRGDLYNRIEVAPGVYQCGCQWGRCEYGDTLVECAIHAQATRARVARFERERTGSNWPLVVEALCVACGGTGDASHSDELWARRDPRDDGYRCPDCGGTGKATRT